MSDDFDCSFYVHSEDFKNINAVIQMGIDSRLTGFTRSEFNMSQSRLYCVFHYSEIEILIRHLLELESKNAEYLADSIIESYYGIEII